MCFGVRMIDWGSHMNDSFDEFGFFDEGHLIVATLELGACEVVPIRQGSGGRGNFRRWGNRFHSSILPQSHGFGECLIDIG